MLAACAVVSYFMCVSDSTLFPSKALGLRDRLPLFSHSHRGSLNLPASPLMASSHYTLQLKSTAMLVNTFVLTTTKFLNHFSATAEERLATVSRDVSRLEKVLLLLETKLYRPSDLPEVKPEAPPVLPAIQVRGGRRGGRHRVLGVVNARGSGRWPARVPVCRLLRSYLVVSVAAACSRAPCPVILPLARIISMSHAPLPTGRRPRRRCSHPWRVRSPSSPWSCGGGGAPSPRTARGEAGIRAIQEDVAVRCAPPGCGDQNARGRH